MGTPKLSACTDQRARRGTGKTQVPLGSPGKLLPVSSFAVGPRARHAPSEAQFPHLPAPTPRPWLDVQGAHRPEAGSGCVRRADRARQPGGPGPRPRTAPPTPLPQQGCLHRLQARYSLAAGYSPGPRRSRPVSPGSPLGRPGRTPAATPRVKAPPGTARRLRTHRGSSPRGTENNGRERPAPHRAHWPPRTPPGNPALLLANPAPGPTAGWGGRAEGIVGHVVHRGGPARGRGAELGLERPGAAARAAGESADWPSRPQGWPELGPGTGHLISLRPPWICL